jgi:hypothetical protein
MDELTLLRSARTDPTGPSRKALDSGRAALLAHIDESRRPAPSPAVIRRRPVLRRIGYSAACTAVAATLVTGLIMSDLVGLAGWRGGADPAAAAVLREASTLAIATSDPVLAPGQYLRVDTTAVYGGTVATGTDNRQIGALTISEDQLYIPADLNDDWVWMRGMSKPYQSFGPESEAAMQAEWAQRLAKRGDPDYQENVRAPGGAFYGGSGPDLAMRDALPRDPYQLLNNIYRTNLGQGPSPDGAAFEWIRLMLRSGAVPADLRGALYEAAAMIPGVTVTEGAATLNGRTGIAIGRNEPGSAWQEDLIIDPTNGELIGERDVVVEYDGGSLFPAGTTEGWTSVTTTVVDGAPTGGNPYGHMGMPG